MRSNRSRRKRIIAPRGFAAAGGGARYLRLRPRRPKASDPEATRPIDLVDRQFYTDGSDRLRVADINRSPVNYERAHQRSGEETKSFYRLRRQTALAGEYG
jgi:hypothetical protein